MSRYCHNCPDKMACAIAEQCLRPPGSNVVEKTGREVIQNRILQALDDRHDCVAILASAADLDVLCRALEDFGETHAREMAKDYRQLQQVAFKS